MGGDWGLPGESEYLVNLASGTGITINSGGATLSLPVLDMSGFKGYYLYQNAIVSGAASYVPIHTNLRWSMTDGITSQFSLREDYEWWAQTNSPGANQEAMFSGIDELQDKCHGNSLAVSWSNQGTSNVTFDYNLFGTTRDLQNPYKAASTWDDMLYENGAVALPAANAYYIIPLPRHWGRTLTHLSNATAVVQVTYQWGSAGAGLYLINGAGSTSLNQELLFPNRAALLRLNRPGGAGAASVFVTALRQRI